MFYFEQKISGKCVIKGDIHFFVCMFCPVTSHIEETPLLLLLLDPRFERMIADEGKKVEVSHLEY